MVEVRETAPLARFFMKYILATKQSMTQVFDENGRVHPATVLTVSPNVVTQVKTEEQDGYEAVQVGTGSKAEKNITKPEKGHLKGKGPFAVLREFRITGDKPELGSEIKEDVFEKGDTVHVSAISKGKGFQGVVKRHNFAGGPRTHGNKHHERTPGSIGAKGVARVFKGRKMPGRMGADRVTVKNLKVLDVQDGTLILSGAVPGHRGTLVEVRSK